MYEIDLDKIDLSLDPPTVEPDRQFYFMAKAREYVKELEKKLGRRPTFFTQTFGCPRYAIGLNKTRKYVLTPDAKSYYGESWERMTDDQKKKAIEDYKKILNRS